jgi:Cap4 dsDNA endonuclease
MLPLEHGGPIARAGFLYQDHIAAKYCIEMLLDPALEQVWCETLDDITLIRRPNEIPVVEFVQVKAADLSQMWTIALICDGNDQSLIARSLAHHRCAEPCSFRIVTRTGVHSDLKVLTFDATASERCIGNPSTCTLHRNVSVRLDGIHSPAGWSISNWLAHTCWDVAESEEAVQHANLLRLERWLEDIGDPLFSDQRSELYNLILTRLMQISALPAQKLDQRKLKRTEFRAWVLVVVQRIRGQMPTKAGANLIHKMELAGIPKSTIDNALDLRIACRRRMLSPKYQQEEDYSSAELELTAVLNQLVARLDSGFNQQNGLTFHAACLDAVLAVGSRYGNVELNFLQGCMYSMTDRCRHRYLPTTVS